MTTPAPLSVSIPHKLLSEPFTLEQRPPLPQQPPQIIPGTLVLRRQPDLPFRELDFSIQKILVDDVADLIHPLAAFRIDVPPEKDEPAMVPGAVVADVMAEERFDVGDFGIGVPEGEVPDEPLAVRPDVVVFGILGEHEGEEGELGCGK